MTEGLRCQVTIFLHPVAFQERGDSRRAANSLDRLPLPIRTRTRTQFDPQEQFKFGEIEENAVSPGLWMLRSARSSIITKADPMRSPLRRPRNALNGISGL